MLGTCRAVKSIAGAVDPARYVAQVRALIPVANTTQVRLAPSKCACPPPPTSSLHAFRLGNLKDACAINMPNVWQLL